MSDSDISSTPETTAEERKIREPMDDASISQLKDELFTKLGERDMHGVAIAAKKIISPNLLDKDFEVPNVMANNDKNEGVYAEYLPRKNLIEISPDAFKNLGLDSDTTTKALLIVLSHELTHAWQAEHAPFALREDMEGHAVLMQSVFAYRMGFTDVNSLGTQMLLRDGSSEKKHLYDVMPRKYAALESEYIGAASEEIMRLSKLEEERPIFS